MSFAVAPDQRAKVAGRICVYCGGAPCDPAHLWPRGRGGCAHPDCIIPLCRPCHDRYDQHALDLLPNLLYGGYYLELAHPIAAHQVSPTRLVERVTNRRWAPEP